jgi:translocation and assembly module TamB
MGGGYASEISNKVGLDQLDFSGGAVTVGKQLSPDLYLNYVRDLFDNSAVIELKYKLSKYFDIKVSTSDNAQAADVLYHFER